MAFAKLPSNGRKGSREMEGGGKSDQCDRFMSPSRLSSMERTQKSRASCDGILLASVVWELWGYTIADSTFPSVFQPSQGLFMLARGVVFGWGLLYGSVEWPLLHFRIWSVKPPLNNVDSRISREVTHLFLTAIFRLEGEFINLVLWAGRGCLGLPKAQAKPGPSRVNVLCRCA